MKIVILSDGFPPNDISGAEVIAGNLAHALSRKGHEISVITTVRDKSLAGIFKDNSLTIYKIYSDYDLRFRSYRSINNPKIVREVGRIVKEIRPDIVHAHNLHRYISYASLKEAKKYSKAVYLTMHDVMSVHYGKLGAKLDSLNTVVPSSIGPLGQFLQYKFYYNPFRNVAIRYYLRSVDKLFSVSLSLKKVLESSGVKGIEALQNGINISDWKVDQSKLLEFKQKYNLENKKVLFFGGRLSSAKGGLISISVLKEVSIEMPDVVLLIVGDKNKSSEEMVKKAESLGVTDRLIFTGRIDHKDIRYAYASSDVVLVLSQYIDPFPTVNLEAMATARPIVGTILGGTREAVLDNKTGYIVNPVDVKGISEKVLVLLSDSKKAEAFGIAGFERVKRNFNENDWAEATLSSYATMLSNKAADNSTHNTANKKARKFRAQVSKKYLKKK